MTRQSCEHSGTHRRLLRRREVLQVGFSTAMGLGLHGILSSARAATEQPSAGPAGAAKNVILIYQTGGASQIDTLDPKPDATESIRGAFHPIATRVPGIQVGEHLPRFASQADRWAIIRSMTHKNAGHLTATHQVLTGRRSLGYPKICPSTRWPRGRTGRAMRRR